LLPLEKEGFELLLKDPLQVHLGHLVSAGLADVLRGVRGHVHPAAAVTEGEPREEVDRAAGGAGLAPALLGEEGVRRVPNLLGYDRLHLRGHPLMGGLQVQGEKPKAPATMKPIHTPNTSACASGSGKPGRRRV